MDPFAQFVQREWSYNYDWHQRNRYQYYNDPVQRVAIAEKVPPPPDYTQVSASVREALTYPAILDDIQRERSIAKIPARSPDDV